MLEYDCADAAERVQAAMDGALIGGNRVCVSFCAPGLPGHQMLPALIAVRTAVWPWQGGGCRSVPTGSTVGRSLGWEWGSVGPQSGGIPTECGGFPSADPTKSPSAAFLVVGMGLQ